MRRPIVLLAAALTAFIGCQARPAPSDAERGWEQGLRATLPPGWRVVAVLGDPGRDRFFCWLEAPGPPARTRRVEVRVSPRPGAPGGRDWEVHVHTPAPPESVVFVAPDDGSGPLEVISGPTDPAAVEAARPLAEEGVRRVRGLNLF